MSFDVNIKNKERVLYEIRKDKLITCTDS